MLKKVEMGKNSKESLTEVSENRKMQDGLGSKMVSLNSPKLKKSIEKFLHGKSETTFYKIAKHNGLKKYLP